MASSNQQRPVKKIKVDEDDDTDHHNQEQVCHDFWNEAPEDLLTEIFVRLVDSRLAARASTVCRRWHSSIRQNPRQFIERFKSHHPPEYSLPWAVVFSPFWCSEANNCHVSSDDWLFLHGKLPAKLFDFLPNSSNMHITASCNDLLLLLSCHKVDKDLYICNPITKQFVHLPAGPRLDDHERRGAIAYAVALTADNVRFKVVKFRLFYTHDQLYCIVPVAVFCSVSREWETRSFPCPGAISGWHGYQKFDDIFTIDGVLYWLGGHGNRQILVYLDLEKEMCGTIPIPCPANTISRELRIGAIPVSGGSHELRVLQVDYTERDNVSLTVWRLNNNRKDDGDIDSNWILVHSRKRSSFAGAFFHPTKGDLVLCVWNRYVIEYNLVDATYKKIAELPKTTDSWSIEKPFVMVGGSNSAAGLHF